ncbi:hypothetical protein LJY25_13270 [Hymenobacter sp. BT175]|uniref:hypothetical protein n=1 Tax=Hymenobacter translucens TaxID=2886507 RepID=UPI001D0E686B|nr:hypothetical protein [Hymenobacter translucens]MCC2547420.1 hypothetical protein [Hymenobacter translucens]
MLKPRHLYLILFLLCLGISTAEAQRKVRNRAGAYSRYDRSGRRNEETLKLAPGLRLNMPSPPTTDYMGRPLKKKPAPARTSSATSLAASTPAVAKPRKKAPTKVRMRKLKTHRR